MAKSAADATRFTSTTPHATARPPVSSPNGHMSARSQPGPPGETPQQKVARLRAAAARAREEKVSTFDKVLVRGRVWADRAHRFTALTLIGLTGIAGVVTVYALGDMMIYNRRKRREYFAEQAALHSARVYEAEQALRRGTITDEQRALLDDESSKRKADQAKAAPKPPGVLARSKNWLFSGLKKEDDVTVAAAAQGQGSGLVYEGTVDEDDVTVEGESPILKAVEKMEREVKERSHPADAGARSEPQGGMLDRLGPSSSSSSSSPEPPKKSGGWTSFMAR